MWRYRDRFGHEIVLTDAVLAVIVAKHPEVAAVLARVSDVLAQPDAVRQSVRRADTVLYYRWFGDVLDGKWLVVVVKRVDQHFVSTCYITDQIKSGETIWSR